MVHGVYPHIAIMQCMAPTQHEQRVEVKIRMDEKMEE